MSVFSTFPPVLEGVTEEGVPSTARAKAPRRTESLSEKAYNHIVNRLLTNDLAPGDILNRREIALELRMSVAPVLEAIVQLENEEFLESKPRKGTLVRSIRREDLSGQLVLREALECEAARIFCGKPVIEADHILRPLAEATDHTSINERERWIAESAFHSALVELTKCRALINTFEKVMRRKLFFAVNLYHRSHPSHDDASHLELLENLHTEDPDVAERAIRQHLRAGKEELFSFSNP